VWWHDGFVNCSQQYSIASSYHCYVDAARPKQLRSVIRVNDIANDTMFGKFFIYETSILCMCSPRPFGIII